MKPKYYSQLDPRWRSHDYSAPGEKRTISSSGCGPTSAAMCMDTLRIDKKITPVTTADWSKKHGYKYPNQGTAYAYFAKQFEHYGISCTQLNTNSLYHNPSHKIHSEAKNILKKPGNFVIACMGPGTWTRGGHYVVAYHVSDDGHVYINDPASKSTERSKNMWSRFKNEVKYYFQVRWGRKCQIKDATKGNLYSKPDPTSKVKIKLKSGDDIWIVKDLKDGWSIAVAHGYVGYLKNSIVKYMLSTYNRATVKSTATLRRKNNKLSKKIGTVPSGSKVQIICRRKYWANIITHNGEKGWIRSKYI